MATMKAPFNFVPISEKVFFPEWADLISHDIPFEDGESGAIDLKITAKTPIFVRNGHTKEEAENKTDNFKSFSNINGKYFIPATSIKGAIRNVLEIMSFGKMDKIANHRYSLRDLHLRSDYLSFFQNSDVHCGWMRQDDGKITISDHGIPRRISHIELDKLWGTDFSNIFKNSTLLRSDYNRTALYKIQLVSGKNNKIRYDEFLMNSINTVDKRIIANVNPTGKHEGIIVLTGQPSARKDRILNPDKTVRKGEGKCFEFVFPDSAESHSCSFDTEDELFKDFCFAHKDSEDWKFWKKELEKGKPIPVFFSMAKGKILHFGLSYLYKLPYKNRVKELLPEKHKSSQLDLSDCIFGSSTKSDSLKGRVQFLHAQIESGTVDREIYAYMGSPKSSYYPIYLKQEGNNGYMTQNFITMMSDKARLKGWKRYPVREEDDMMDFYIPDGQNAQANPITPISKGAIFNCKIRFHNLKKVEIGALLYAIDLKNSGLHSIGFAKSHGFGSVKIQPNISKCKFSLDEYKSSFIDMMVNFDSNYTESTQLKELNLMSIPQKMRTPLKYMNLSEFVECKKQNFKKDITGEYLENYSSIVKQAEPQVEVKELLAEITFSDSRLTTAKLKDSKDTSKKVLKDTGKKTKLKAGDIVAVKISIKKDELIFQKKI